MASSKNDAVGRKRGPRDLQSDESAADENQDEAGMLGAQTVSNSDDDDVPGKSFTDQFLEEMVDLYLERTLNARHFCTLMFLLGKCGPDLQARAQDYGKRPGVSAGHYERHLKNKLKIFLDKSSSGYVINMPGCHKHAWGRVTHQLRVFG